MTEDERLEGSNDDHGGRTRLDRVAEMLSRGVMRVLTTRAAEGVGSHCAEPNDPESEQHARRT